MSIPYIATHYAGRKYRSRTEARWAVFFDAAGIRFQYEFEGFVLRSGAYLPDFWLPDLNLYLEVKGGEPSDEERLKCEELAAQAEVDIVLAVGAPEERFNLIWFDRGGEREERYVFARDAHSLAGFWLVAEDLASWLGPAAPGLTHRDRRGPMFSGALEAAYSAAMSARFERGDGKVRHPVIAEEDPERTLAWLRTA